VPFARLVVRLLPLAGAVVLAGPATAQTPPTMAGGLPPPDAGANASLQALEATLDRSADAEVVEVGPRKVTWGDIADEIRALPSIAGGVPYSVLYQRAGVEIMERQALALRAEAVGLDKDPAVQRRMRNAADAALAPEMLRRSLAPNLTEKALRATYDALVANKAAPEEVRARLSMVDTQAEATALIGRLHQGANFAELARQYSKDGTAQNGGDLGFARLDMLSPEIGSGMFALAPGQMTEYPVRSHAAWFIIRVEERRQPPAPTFEAARVALEQDIIHADAPVLMQAALKAAPIKYHGLAGQKGDQTADKKAP
jgi:peptidyl-prolyl cis-trans isomerase C